MANYNGPEMPEEPDDLEHISDEDVLRQIRENFGEEEPLAIEVSQDEAEEIKKFLIDFNVKEADGADIEDIDMLWRRFNGSPSLVKDFVYNLITLKEALNHSTHPLAVSIEEILHYAGPLKSPEDVRPWLIAHTAPAIGRLGFDTFHYTDRALSESKNPRVRPDSIRFLGWVVSQGFLMDLPTKKKDFIRKHRLGSFTIPDLASLVTIEVGEELDRLDHQTTSYRQVHDMEREALEHSHTDVIIAMRGIKRMCGILFLSKPTEK
jgi:hypothetical protein